MPARQAARRHWRDFLGHLVLDEGVGIEILSVQGAAFPMAVTESTPVDVKKMAAMQQRVTAVTTARRYLSDEQCDLLQVAAFCVQD